MKKLGIIFAAIFVLALVVYFAMQTNWYKKMQVTNTISKLDQIKIVEFETNLPEQMPEDIVITYAAHGGMINIGDSIRITKKEQTYAWTREDMDFNEEGIREKTLDMNLSGQEIKQIYAQLRRYGFDTIKEVEDDEITYDGGATRISITMTVEGEKKQYDVTQGEYTHVEKKHIPQWNVSVKLFEDLIAVYNK